MAKVFIRTIAVTALIGALLFQVRIAEAKGPPEKVIITGPGLMTPIEITEASQLQVFSIYGFENIDRRIPEPKDPGQGYVITRYVKDGANLIEWDRLVYYPQPTGKPGYVFYEGLRQPGMSSEFDGYWYPASQTGDAAMRRILLTAGSAGASQAGQPGAESRSPFIVMLAAVLLMLIVLSMAGMILVRRQARHSQSG